MPGAYVCTECDAAWPEKLEKPCPCGAPRQPYYNWMKVAQTAEEACATAFEVYYANRSIRELHDELEQIESD